MRAPGFGTRFDKFTPNAVDLAREDAPGAGVRVRYAMCFCAKCQKDKDAKGGKKRAGLFVCADCLAPREAA